MAKSLHQVASFNWKLVEIGYSNVNFLNKLVCFKKIRIVAQKTRYLSYLIYAPCTLAKGLYKSYEVNCMIFSLRTDEDFKED